MNLKAKNRNDGLEGTGTDGRSYRLKESLTSTWRNARRSNTEPMERHGEEGGFVQGALSCIGRGMQSAPKNSESDKDRKDHKETLPPQITGILRFVRGVRGASAPPETSSIRGRG